MIELVRSNDIVLIGALEALLRSAGIEPFVADQHMNALEGMIGAFPRRILVVEDEAEKARQLLREAGYGGELRQP